MRWLKNKGICFLVLAFLVMRNGLTVSAAEEEYTYTVRLYAGNQGRLLGGRGRCLIRICRGLFHRRISCD